MWPLGEGEGGDTTQQQQQQQQVIKFSVKQAGRLIRSTQSNFLVMYLE